MTSQTTIHAGTMQGLVVERIAQRLVVDIGGEFSNPTSSTFVKCFEKTNIGENSAVVGDIVDVDVDQLNSPFVGTITGVRKRFNVLERPAPACKGRQKLVMKSIASNIDQIVIVTATTPKVSLLSVDQLLVAASALEMTKCIIVINKIDFLNDKFSKSMDVYRKLGYEVVETSTATGTGLSILEEYLASKTTVFVGQSGIWNIA